MSENILISACLLGQKCRYNGKDSLNTELMGADINWVPVCPEELAGLGTPRPAAEIQSDGSIKTNKGIEVTIQFSKGSAEAIKIAASHNCGTAILKSRSPSCGKGEIYDGTFSNILINDDGVFTKLCKKNGIKVISSNEIDKIEEIINPL